MFASQIHDIPLTLTTVVDAESRWTIPKWLSKSSPIRFDEKHRDTFEVAKKTPDTWKWLLDYPDFKSWRDWEANSDDDEPRRLLCSGIRKQTKATIFHTLSTG